MLFGIPDESSESMSDRYDENGHLEGGGWHNANLDPNEPRYCICNQVSYGEMVACDNANVMTSCAQLACA